MSDNIVYTRPTPFDRRWTAQIGSWSASGRTQREARQALLESIETHARHAGTCVYRWSASGALYILRYEMSAWVIERLAPGAVRPGVTVVDDADRAREIYERMVAGDTEQAFDALTRAVESLRAETIQWQQRKKEEHK